MQRRALMAAAAGLLAAPAVRAAEERRFDSAGVPIRFIEEGRGEPVILLHGYTTNTEGQWVNTGVFPALVPHFRTIAMDARGHGRSGKPHDRAAYGPEMGRDVTRLMDHLGLRKAHIVGYSMGAHIVAQLAILDPGRFATLTLGGAAGRLGWTAEDQRRVDEESAEMDGACCGRSSCASGRATGRRRARRKSARIRSVGWPVRMPGRSRRCGAPTPTR